MRDADYREAISKEILEMKFPEKFIGLVKGESPDWHTDSIGLEVRRAVISDDAFFESFHNKYNYKFMKEIPAKILSKLGFDDEPILINEENKIYIQKSEKVGQNIYVFDTAKNDYRLVAMIGKVQNPNVENALLIIDALKDKTKKLVELYTEYPENDLILVMNDFLQYGACKQDILASFNECKAQIINDYNLLKFEKKFDYVYLLFNDSIVEIGIKSGEFRLKVITQEDWDKIKQEFKE